MSWNLIVVLTNESRFKNNRARDNPSPTTIRPIMVNF